ncbi:MAG: HAMP domain-containing histidine kinase [Thermoproteota archaeon]|nr:HAMP domain-containing histidine kinase [Thermoproteota archaeon]
MILSRDFNGENVRLLYDPQDILVEADKGRMTQVFSNLLSNAVQFTKHGSITITSEARDGQLIVCIKDTGPGMHPEILSRLFTKFATKSITGSTGLGLFISKSIIEAHGGRIWAENNKGDIIGNSTGATFVFNLPIRDRKMKKIISDTWLILRKSLKNTCGFDLLSDWKSKNHTVLLTK